MTKVIIAWGYRLKQSMTCIPSAKGFKSLTEESSGKTPCGAPPSLKTQYNNRDVIVIVGGSLFQ